jgi:tetratricopeptide (TPR) repeat protein
MIRLGRGPLAILELQHAIELKADYWPPYAAISDYYKESGQVAEAREWLEKGLSVTPDVKALKTRMADLERTKDKRKSASPQSQEKQTAR